MRRACCLLMVLVTVCASGFGQSAPKFTHPRIVATFQRLGQTAEIPPTTIYTPKNWGTFRISIVMVLTVANNNNGDWDGLIEFIDGAGASGGGPSIPTKDRNRALWESPIRAKAGQPLKFSVRSFPNTSGSKYNVWVVVEQLM
jgi:hypothetical protein